MHKEKVIWHSRPPIPVQFYYLSIQNLLHKLNNTLSSSSAVTSLTMKKTEGERYISETFTMI